MHYFFKPRFFIVGTVSLMLAVGSTASASHLTQNEVAALQAQISSMLNTINGIEVQLAQVIGPVPPPVLPPPPPPNCDGNPAPVEQGGRWNLKWGTWASEATEPSTHYCSQNNISAKLTSAGAEPSHASGLMLAEGLEGNDRKISTSFMVPALSDWSHIAVMPAIEKPGDGSAGYGRIGGDVFREFDQSSGSWVYNLYIQYNVSADVGCNGSTLKNPVRIPNGIRDNAWYRVSTNIEDLGSNGLSVTTKLDDISSDTSQTVTTSYTAPASCRPSWYDSRRNSMIVGNSATAANVSMNVDDIIWNTASRIVTPPPPPPPPTNEKGLIRVRRVGEDDRVTSAPDGSTPAEILRSTGSDADYEKQLKENPAVFRRLSSGTYTVIVPAIEGYAVSVGACADNSAGTGCRVTRFNPVTCDYKWASFGRLACTTKIDLAKDQAQRVVFKYTSTTGRASLRVRRVESDGQLFAEPTLAQYEHENGLVSGVNTNNPFVTRALPRGKYTVYTTFVSGYEVHAGTCRKVRADESAECEVLLFRKAECTTVGPLRCFTNVSLADGAMTKVVFKYIKTNLPPPPPGGSLTQAQIDSIISLLQSFGATPVMIDNARTALTGGTPTNIGPSPLSDTQINSIIDLLQSFGAKNIIIRNIKRVLVGNNMPPPPPPFEIIQNGNFEAGSLSPWQFDSFANRCLFELQGGAGVRGSSAAVINCPTKDDARLIQTVRVQPNTDYVLSGYIKTDNIADVDGIDGNTNNVGASLSIMDTWDHSIGIRGTSDWSAPSIQFNSGNKTEVKIGLRLGHWSGMTTGKVYFDAISLSRIIPPPPTDATLEVSKSVQVIDQNIAYGAISTLGGFDVEVTGTQPINVTDISFDVGISGATGSERLVDVGLYSPTGALIGGPVDMVNGRIRFTDGSTQIFLSGKQTYVVKGRISSAFVANQTVQLKTNPATQWVGIPGSTFPITIKPNSSVPGQVMTVKVGALSLKLAGGQAVQKGVLAGRNDVLMTMFDIDAQQSAEDMLLTSLPLKYNFTGVVNDLQNCRIVDDATKTILTSGSNQVNPAGTPSGAEYRFTFDSPVRFTRGAVSRWLSVNCDVGMRAGIGSTYTWSLPAVADAVGAITGNRVPITITQGTAPTIIIRSDTPPPPPPVLAPTNLRGSVYSGGIYGPAPILLWDYSGSSLNFVLESSLNTSFSPLRSSTGVGAKSFIDDSTTANGTYYYRVKAVNGGVSSAYSNTVSVTLPAVTTSGDIHSSNLASVISSLISLIDELTAVLGR